MENSKRLIALDIFRGLTIALMILVNNPGNSSSTYPALLHSKWDGCTPTDLVFPFFMFIVGSAMWYSYKRYNYTLDRKLAFKILKRTLAIYLIGLLINACSMFSFDLSKIRIMGVLARIAIGYGIASFIVLGVRSKWIKWIVVIILLMYWGILLIFGGDSPFSLEGNFVRIFDAAVLGVNHMPVRYGFSFDHTGLLSTLPSIANILLGYLAGSLIDKSEIKLTAVKKLIIWGITGIIVGKVWGFVFPINKLLWTSSYVLYTSGFASIFLGILFWVTDIKGFTKWSRPFQIFGMNSIFIYVFSELLAICLLIRLIPSSAGGSVSLHKWIYNSVFLPVAGPFNGSLLYAITFTCICWFVGWILFNKKIFIKL